MQPSADILRTHKEASLPNKVSVQRPPLAIHQIGITGIAINHRNKVLIAIWPQCPHDMICRILLPPKPQRLSQRLLGCMNGEEVKRARSEAKVALTKSRAAHVFMAKVTLRLQAAAETENTADFLLH